MRLTAGVIRIVTCALALCLCAPVSAYADLIGTEPADDAITSEDKQEDATQGGASQDTQNDDQTKPDTSEFPRELTQEEYDRLSKYIRENYKGIHYDEHGLLVDGDGMAVQDEEEFIIDERGGMGKWPPEDDIDSPIDAASFVLRHYTPAVVVTVVAVATTLIFRLRRRKK